MRDFPELAEKVERRADDDEPGRVDAGHRERTAQMIRLAELLAAGYPADADPVQAEIDAQYRALTELRASPPRSTARSGAPVSSNEPWRAAYEAIAPGLAAYQRDAIEAYATTRLS